MRVNFIVNECTIDVHAIGEKLWHSKVGKIKQKHNENLVRDKNNK